MDRDQEYVDIEDLCSNVKDITSLAHFARCQAQEAEMRANYAVNLADRAVSEADAVRTIAESLTKTARSVAKMSLEHMDRMNTTEYRSLKRGDILAAVRQTLEKKSQVKKTPTAPTSPRRRHQTTPQSTQRGAVSEEAVGTNHLLTQERTISDSNLNNTSSVNFVTDHETQNQLVLADSDNQSSKFDPTDMLCVEALHGQNGSPFTLPEVDEIKEDDVKDSDIEQDPIVFEKSYQDQIGRKPMQRSNKKNVRKTLKKLHDLELTVVDNSSDVTAGNFEVKTENLGASGACESQKDTEEDDTVSNDETEQE